MDVEMVVRNVQIILAPVVLMTVCAILVQAILGRYSAINDRLRALMREKLELVAGGGGSAALRLERQHLVEAQIPRLLRHHRRLRDALQALYAAEGIFITSMFVIAGAALTGSTMLATVALGMFLLGAGVLFAGVLLTAVEVRAAHAALDDEVQQVLTLGP
jgi:hypothetical protein